ASRHAITGAGLSAVASAKADIRKSKTSRWRAAALMTLNLFMIAHIIQWRVMGKTVSPIEPSETMQTIQGGFVNAGFIFFSLAIPFLFVCGFVTVYFLGQKGFCTYACPYGGFFALADQFSPGQIRVTAACNQCGHCTATCTSNVMVHAEVKQYGMVVDPGCMK